MALKKSELYSSLWSSCDELRGGMDASQYKELEPTHNSRFMTLMDLFMPAWRFHRAVLNRLPVRHQSWGY